MTISNSLPADSTAERIVRHFQAQGLPGITEAVLVRIRLKKGDRLAVDAAFDRAQERDAAPPLQEFFQMQLHGHYSEQRGLLNIKTAFADDFTRALRAGMPSIYFDTAPVVANDAMATGTKYDAMLKLSDNADGCAVAVLLNDPTSSFFEYMESHAGFDWQTILGTLGAAAASFTADDEDLLTSVY